MHHSEIAKRSLSLTAICGENHILGIIGKSDNLQRVTPQFHGIRDSVAVVRIAPYLRIVGVIKPIAKADQRRVWVVRDNRLVPVTVTIGQNNGIKVEIVSGLKAGDVVATGYDESFAEARPEGGQQSPFAPRPPGGNRKK